VRQEHDHVAEGDLGLPAEQIARRRRHALYGTCVMRTPAIEQNNSAIRCCAEPTPPVG